MAKEEEVTVTVAVVVTVNIWVADLLLVLAVALTVGLMGIGLVTAKLATGKIGAIVVEIVATLKGIARTALRTSSVERVTPDLHLLAAEGCVIGATAGAAVGATAALFPQGGMKGDQGALATVAAQGGAPVTVSAPGGAPATVAAL